jgi:hypothetical protein
MILFLQTANDLYEPQVEFMHALEISQKRHAMNSLVVILSILSTGASKRKINGFPFF